MLYVVFFISAIIHGPLVWMFFCVPGFIFIIEKLSNTEFVKLARFGRTYVKEVNLLPSKVSLIMKYLILNNKLLLSRTLSNSKVEFSDPN